MNFAMKHYQTIRYYWNHPFGARDRLGMIARILRYQSAKRLLKTSIIHPFVNDARIILGPGMGCLSGNAYVGLQELPEMGFLLHVLRSDDLFVDVGSNFGSFTILAAKVVGAQFVCFEPVPHTYSGLLDNIRLNGVENQGVTHMKAVDAQCGSLRMTTTLGASNHLLVDGSECDAGDTIMVDVTTLDETLGGRTPTLIKIDAENHDADVLRGAKNVLERPELHALIVETSDQRFKRKSVHGDNPLGLLREFGFQEIDYDPLNRRLTPISGAHPENLSTIFVRDIEDTRRRTALAPRFSVLGKYEI